jgi:hypothetical protein
VTPIEVLAQRAAESRARMAAAFAAVAATGRQASSHLSELRLAVRRLTQVVLGPRHGLGNFDPLDGTWQSDSCATWLHDFCPAASACDCTCHGGTRR